MVSGAPDSACASVDASPSGTTKITARAKLLRFGSDTPIPRSFSRFVVDAIATHLVLPDPLALGVYSAMPDSGSKSSAPPTHFFPVFSAEFLVVFRRDGSVKNLSLSQQSLAPALDAAIARAIHVADSTLSFPPIDEATDKQELTVFIDFDMDSPPSETYPVFRVTVPLYPFTRLASQLRTTIAPKYPEELRAQGIAGRAVLQFVVDESGKVADHSYRFVKLSEMPFGQSVLDVLPRLRYMPAKIGNCAVKQLVQQSFDFKLER